MANFAVPAPARFSGPLVLSALAGALLLGAALTLWSYYGTAVFFEMIVAGIANCL
jgi:hypothetical protein